MQPTHTTADQTQQAATAVSAVGPATASDLVATATARAQDAFLQAFADVGNVTAAAKLADVGRRTHYDWMGDAAYAARFADAVDEAADRLEAEARRRAVEGVAETVYYKGEPLDVVRKYSDGLLVFLLKASRPEKYAEHRVLSGKGKQGAIVLEDIVAADAAPPDA